MLTPTCMICHRRPGTIVKGKARYCNFCAPGGTSTTDDVEGRKIKNLYADKDRRRAHPELHVWVPLKLVREITMIPSSLMHDLDGVWDRKTKAFLLSNVEGVERAREMLAGHGMELYQLPNGGWKARR